MKKRMDYRGGKTADGRFAKGKLLSFRKALNNSYQAETITFNNKQYRCLINPDSLKVDYDQKEISIDFEANMHNGDVFYWDRVDSHWICYLQRHEEEAYFRAQIRECKQFLEINNNKYWVYVRGPVETAIVWRQKHQLEMNDLNYSLMFYITKNEETVNYLKRLQVVKFDGHNWRIATTDKYSQDGILEVYLEEYYDNAAADIKLTEEEEPGTVIEEVYIDGPATVRPYDKNVAFSIVGNTSGTFVVNSNKVKINEMDNLSCVLNITTGKSGTFEISYVDEDEEILATKEITIKSL